MPVLSRARSPQLRPSPSAYAPFVAIAATVLACFAVSTRLEAPPTVAALTIVNRTQWAAAVGVTNAGQRRRRARRHRGAIDHPHLPRRARSLRLVGAAVRVPRRRRGGHRRSIAARRGGLEAAGSGRFRYAPRASWPAPDTASVTFWRRSDRRLVKRSVSCVYGRRNGRTTTAKPGAATLDGDRRSMDAAPAPR